MTYEKLSSGDIYLKEQESAQQLSTQPIHWVFGGGRIAQLTYCGALLNEN
jgi:hypothetical protein